MNGKAVPAPIRKAWGNRIREARLARRWSQEELGERLDPPVSQQAVAQWELGLSAPRLHHQLGLSRVYGTPHSTLFSIPAEAVMA